MSALSTLWVVVALFASALPGLAQGQPVERKALRVCQDPNNLPFSDTNGTGIENRIAEVFGKALGLPVTYYSFPQRLRIHPQHASLQAAGGRLPLRYRDGRAGRL